MIKLECLLLVFVLMTSVVARKEPLLGRWSPIKNINDPKVIEIANYAIATFDKRFGTKKKLEKMIEGETRTVEGLKYKTRIVAGMDYFLIFRANDEYGEFQNYGATVRVIESLHFRNLTGFVPANS
ncbi:hypothetical protein AAZX31_08G166600 [Glycine max]|uniref:Cysteine proteinase inhibitor 5 n=1 Tax=Glycine soja TaxID=3848 RepID=A0A445JFN9_GLYSO|nr:cysteine proteinase inhibitor 5-like [Glycine soja]KAG5000441.1 hypothetical protein JHK87_021513 [Glycine soja]KAG5015910.1 hypothetical protein JHK85_022046 [Glycine max]KHN26851.1 Cysteine proteinase inhibitor 5 [Glycine soja]RZB97280.1 Cysteine proteinase inhibitor 5 [Glycine soja]